MTIYYVGRSACAAYCTSTMRRQSLPLATVERNHIWSSRKSHKSICIITVPTEATTSTREITKVVSQNNYCVNWHLWQHLLRYDYHLSSADNVCNPLSNTWAVGPWEHCILIFCCADSTHQCWHWNTVPCEWNSCHWFGVLWSGWNVQLLNRP